MNDMPPATPMAERFRGFLPVVVDVETGGFNETTDALLQVAAVLIDIDDGGRLYCWGSHLGRELGWDVGLSFATTPGDVRF